jgi:hypothetical protein
VELILVGVVTFALLVAIAVLILQTIILIKQTQENKKKNQKLSLKNRIISPQTGQFEPDDEFGRADGLTADDIAWANEHGALNDQDVLDMVSKHKTEVGR